MPKSRALRRRQKVFLKVRARKIRPDHPKAAYYADNMQPSSRAGGNRRRLDGPTPQELRHPIEDEVLLGPAPVPAPDTRRSRELAARMARQAAAIVAPPLRGRVARNRPA